MTPAKRFQAQTPARPKPRPLESALASAESKPLRDVAHDFRRLIRSRIRPTRRSLRPASYCDVNLRYCCRSRLQPKRRAVRHLPHSWAGGNNHRRRSSNRHTHNHWSDRGRCRSVVNTRNNSHTAATQTHILSSHDNRHDGGNGAMNDARKCAAGSIPADDRGIADENGADLR